MVFNSLHFGIFFILIASLYFALPYKYRWLLLLIGSYYFYMCGGPVYALVMFSMTIVSYFCGLKMGQRESKKNRKPFLVLGLVIDLGLLFVFKYLGFFTRSAAILLKDVNILHSMPELKILLPIGISFYTLQTLSYLFDVFAGKMEPERHFGYLALYVSFFPTVLAGPIERGAHLLPQLHNDYDFDYARITDSMKLIAWGLFKKVVIADWLASFVNLVFNNVRSYTGFTLLAATVFFAIQLYCDFSGYTDMARGCARILGYDLLINFNLPYFARNMQDFWRRWHISMTSWFRDYLYIPLGGNRVSTLRNYFNIFIVFLVSGLWHGASWTFIAWGALHGTYQIIGKATRGTREQLVKKVGINPDGKFSSVYKAIITFCLVDFAWIFFRANSLRDAGYIVKNMFKFNFANLKAVVTLVGAPSLLLDGFLILFLLMVQFIQLRGPIVPRLNEKPTYVRWAGYVTLVSTILLFAVAGSPTFIYMRF